MGLVAAPVNPNVRETILNNLSMSEPHGNSVWNSLPFVFWVYLIGGCIVLQFVASANLYYLFNANENQTGPVVLMMVGQLVAALHALSALYLVWRSSGQSRPLARVTSRSITVLYLLAIFGGIILWGYFLLIGVVP